MTMSIDDHVAAHLAAWNSTDGPERERAIAAAYATDVVVHDPGGTSRGRIGMAEAIAGVQAQLPNTMVRRTAPIRSVNDLVTFPWAIGPDGQPPMATGRDVLIIGGDAITTVYVLLDTPES